MQRMRAERRGDTLHLMLSELSPEEFAVLDIARESGPTQLLRRNSCQQCFGFHEPEEGCVWHSIDGAIG